MAEMERITFSLLKNHLAENAENYNLQIRRFEMQHGSIDRTVFSSWMVKVIEPVIMKIEAQYPGSLPEVFNAFFTEFLRLLSNKSALFYENEYARSWSLCGEIPGIFAKEPLNVIRAVDSALESLRKYQPGNVMKWISRMEKTLDETRTIEEFLSSGRIHAWLCGMAHLRLRAGSDFSAMRNELKQKIEKAAEIDNIDSVINPENEWSSIKRPGFIGVAGGFTGFGGPFISPPVVADVDGEILATDGNNSCAFFGDCFGMVLLTETGVPPQMIVEQYPGYPYGFLNRNSIHFNDITSCAVRRNTMVLTRESSFYLYVYGRL